jgi:hypothetical protein
MKPDGIKYYTDMDGYGALRSRLLMRKRDGTSMNTARAREELAILIEASRVVASIRTTAVDFSATRTGENLRTAGAEVEHDKHGFVYRLAEAWIYLTGKLPGRSKERSPS